MKFLIKEKEYLYANGDFSDDKVNDRLAELEIICAEEDPTYEVDVTIEKILASLGLTTADISGVTSDASGTMGFS